MFSILLISFFFILASAVKLPQTRVELHLHLDGSVRVPTLLDLVKRKNIKFDENQIELVKSAAGGFSFGSLRKFLEFMDSYIPALIDDLDALERIAYELCEDQAKEGVIYFEARYAPHLLVKNRTTEEAVIAIQKGLKRGEKDFNIKTKSILCALWNTPEWSPKIIELCKKFKRDGVAGIDVAGNEITGLPDKRIIQMYKDAKKLGIHRTLHFAENKIPFGVDFALDEMHVERFGHGYQLIRSEEEYKKLLKRKVHFEICPYSSLFTGSIQRNETHPILKLVEDNRSFSISRDDILVTQKTLSEEYQYLLGLGLSEAHLVRANINAIKAAFITEAEKEMLIKKILKALTQ